MQEVLFKTEVFEGPLDLLLSLISKHKLNIWDVPLADITDQYIKSLRDWEAMDIEYSSEFLVVAAELLYIKSKSLLPKEKEEPEQDDPEQLLKERLYWYSVFKGCAAHLTEAADAGKYLFVKLPEPIRFPPAPIPPQSTDKLIAALLNLSDRREAAKPPEKKAFSEVIAQKPVSIFSKVRDILKKIKRAVRVKYTDLFTGTKSEKVASFLAVLELLKLNRIDIKETGGELMLTNNRGDSDDD